MIDDAEPYAVLRQTERKARKPHTCGECNRSIASGETYEYASGVYDGCWYHHLTCAHCVKARGWLMAECNGWCFGGVAEDLRDHWDEDVLLRAPSLGRLVIGIQRRWHKKNGELMPLEVAA